MVDYAREKFFGNVKNNLKGIADRRRGPLKRVLLSYPETVSSTTDSIDSPQDALVTSK